MKRLFHFNHCGDNYEISLHGYIISRISCYVGGMYRQDMQFDDVPEIVQDRILEEVKKVLEEE